MEIYRQAPKDNVPWDRISDGKVQRDRAEYFDKEEGFVECVQLRPSRESVNIDCYFVRLQLDEVLLAFLALPRERLKAAVSDLEPTLLNDTANQAIELLRVVINREITALAPPQPR
jgi:hypothetical protein